jgi:hypothetical protein
MCWLAIVAFAIPTRTLPLRISRLNVGRATENIKQAESFRQAGIMRLQLCQRDCLELTFAFDEIVLTDTLKKQE